jgi:hypothetical protein
MGIVSQARDELALINFGKEDTQVLIEILEKFFAQWDSGGAVSIVAPILMRCIAGKPLSPLTGKASEWMYVGDGFEQNRRCSTVFRMKATEAAYNIDEPGRPMITFPYWPDQAEVRAPIYEVGQRVEAGPDDRAVIIED